MKEEIKEVLSEGDRKIVTVAIAIEKEGQATIKEIKIKVDKVAKKEKLGFSLTTKQIERICNKLQKKNIISTNYVQGEGGLSILAYSPSKPLFSRGVEGMQFMDIVDSEGNNFIKQLDKKKGANKGKLPDIRDYYDVKVRWKVIDETGVLGFMPFHETGYNEHYRNRKGEIILMPKHFRAYIRYNQRKVNKTSLHNYMSFDYGIVTLNGNKLTKVDHFILDGQQGRGKGTHEVIPPNSEIETTFGVPGTVINPEDLKDFLEKIAPRPIRGLSGASSQGYGKLELIDFQVI